MTPRNILTEKFYLGQRPCTSVYVSVCVPLTSSVSSQTEMKKTQLGNEKHLEYDDTK